MRRVYGIILLGGIAIAAPVNATAQTSAPATTKTAALDPASLALAHQILAIAFPPEKRSGIMNSVMDSIVDQTRKNTENLKLIDDKDLQAIVDRSTQRMFAQLKVSLNASLPDYFDSMERAYARSFSRGDLEAILAFVKTPAGQRYFERAPDILKDPNVQAAGQRMTAQLVAKLPEMQNELMREIEDYVAKKQKDEQAAAPKPVT